MYFLVQFSSQDCKYLALKLLLSAIKVGSTLVHAALSVPLIYYTYMYAKLLCITWYSWLCCIRTYL